MSLPPSAAARKEDEPRPQGLLNRSDEADNGEDGPMPMRSGSLKDLDEAVKSKPLFNCR